MMTPPDKSNKGSVIHRLLPGHSKRCMMGKASPPEAVEDHLMEAEQSSLLRLHQAGVLQTGP